MAFRDDWEEEEPEYVTKRNQAVVSIRRQNREELIWKRRLSIIKTNKERYTSTVILDHAYEFLIKKFVAQDVEVSMTGNFIELLQSEDVVDQHAGAIGLRKLLIGASQYETISVLRSCKIISRLYLLALQSELLHLQYQAVWILVNLISGIQNITQEDHYILFEVANIFDTLFDKPTHPKILEHAIWGIGNIACEEISSQKKILSSQTINKIWKRVSQSYILQYISPQRSLSPELFPQQNQPVFSIHFTGQFDQSCLQSACWAFSNILRRDPDYYGPLTGSLLFFICLMLTNDIVIDQSINLQCIETIAKTIDTYLSNFKDILRTRIVEKIYRQLQQNDERMVLSFLRICGAITNGSQYIADYLMSIKIFPFLAKQLQSNIKIIRRSACWILSNFVTNGESYLLYLVETLPTIINDLAVMFFSDEERVRNELSYFFRNMIHTCKNIDIETVIIETGLLYGYVELLKSTEIRILKDTLINLFAIFKTGIKIANMKNRSENLFALEFQRLEGVNILEKLQRHPDIKIYYAAGKILANFYEVQSEQILSFQQYVPQ